MSQSSTTPQSTVPPISDVAPVNAWKSPFLTDMELAGMMAVSRKRYLFAVERLIRRYGCSPADLTEPQVHDYRLACHRRNPAKTTFKLTQYALRLFSRDTLGRDWKLFKKMKPLRQKRRPKALRHDECMRIIQAVEHPVYRTCLKLMYRCGLRLGEAIKIQVSHIDKSTSNLSIIGKYNRQQIEMPTLRQ
jgi:integrase